MNSGEKQNLCPDVGKASYSFSQPPLQLRNGHMIWVTPIRNTITDLELGASDTTWQTQWRLFRHSSCRSADWVLVEQGCSTHRPVLQQDLGCCSLMCSLKLGSAVFLASIVNSYSFNKLFHYLNQSQSLLLETKNFNWWRLQRQEDRITGWGAY